MCKRQHPVERRFSSIKDSSRGSARCLCAPAKPCTRSSASWQLRSTVWTRRPAGSRISRRHAWFPWPFCVVRQSFVVTSPWSVRARGWGYVPRCHWRRTARDSGSLCLHREHQACSKTNDAWGRLQRKKEACLKIHSHFWKFKSAEITDISKHYTVRSYCISSVFLHSITVLQMINL